MNSRSAALAALGAFCLSMFGSGIAAAAGEASIERLSGNVLVIGADNKQRKAAANEKLSPGESVLTEAKSEALIKMVDESTVALRQNSQFKFNEFKYEQKPTDSFFVSVIRGSMRIVSGLIGKATPTSVRINAQTATIGIRGTDFEIAVIEQDTPEARAGIYDYVRDGETVITIASGQSLGVKKEQTGFAPDKLRPGEEPLQLLAQPPLFLQQGGGFDALIQSLTSTPINVIHHMPMPMFR